MKRLPFLAVLVVLCWPALAHAVVLQAEVAEVHDGKTITVTNMGRQLKVVLMGADAPEAGQVYGDVARQHLADLILGRRVAVEYTELRRSESVVARVYFDKVDIGQQMIRDGVAWYDRNYEKELSATDRRLYAESEQAARSEHRGLWQDATPTPPWEWRQARAAEQRIREEQSAALATGTPSSTSVAPSSSEMPVNDVGKGKLPVAPVQPRDVKWPLFSPDGELFSVRIPGGGKSVPVEVEVPNGQPIQFNFYTVSHLKMEYVVFWGTGPYTSEAITSISDKSITEYNEGLQRAFAARGIKTNCALERESESSTNGFTRRNYRSHGCPVTGALRLFYRIEGKRLRVYMIAASSEIPGNPLVDQFLESFVLHREANSSSKTAANRPTTR